MSSNLSKDYVVELVACCIKNKKVLDICASHLKYEYLQTEAQKRVVKALFDTYSLSGDAPTFGALQQKFAAKEDIINFLIKVKRTKITNETSVLDTFEEFIKDMKFQQLYDKLAKLYNEGKSDEAFQLLKLEGQEIAEFTIKAKRYVEVFTQFEERMEKRERVANSDEGILREKLTTGIHEFDHHTKGGFRKGTSFLAMARSGIGKSTYLRWVALCNARLGRLVVVFQNEDTEDNAMAAMDAAWTGVTMENVESANVSWVDMDKIKKVRKEILQRGGRLYVVPTESFNKMTIEECRDIMEEIVKIEGRSIDMALWDYLEIYTTKGSWGKGESAERFRREDIANKIVGIATEFKCVTGTATQSTDIAPDKLLNPDFNLTRHHASEFKNVIKPFAYFFTFNATDDEYQREDLRIWLDKLRKHPAAKSIKICQARDNGRFYDALKTKTLHYDYNAVNVR